MQTHKVEEEVGTLLYYASKGNVQIIKHMLDNGTAVDAADYDGRTALHLAASEGHVAAVKLLLSYNANVNPLDRYNDTVSLVPPPHSAFYLIHCFLMLFVTCETLFLKWPGKPRIFYHSSMLWTAFVGTDLFTGEVKWLERLFLEAFRKLIWVQISCSHWIMHLCLIIRKSARFWMHMVDLQRCLPSFFLHATCLDSVGVPSSDNHA